MSENARYINPLTDYGFKLIFGTEVNKDLLIDFLNQILPPNRQIKDVNYTSSENLGDTKEGRIAVFDVQCKGTDGEQFIIEMQNGHQLFFKDRSLFYATYPIQQQGPKGPWNFKLEPVFTFCVLDFVFKDEILKKKQRTLHKIYLCDEDGDIFYDKLAFFYVELPNFEKGVEELDTQFDKWIYVLKHLAGLKDRPKALQERVFRKLFKAAEVANFSPQERKAYDESMKQYNDLGNMKVAYHQAGVLEERERGEKKLEQERQRGDLRVEEERRKLEEKLRESALSMEAGGLSLEQISNFLNIPIDEVKRLLGRME